MKLGVIGYVKEREKTLMLYRNKKENDMHEGKWNGLGGKFEPGESPEEALHREVLEESGLTITNPQMKGVITFPKFDDIDDWYVYLFVIEEFKGELIDCLEGELHWVDDDKISDLNLWEGDHLFMDWLRQDKFFSAKFCYGNGRLLSHEVNFY